MGIVSVKGSERILESATVARESWIALLTLTSTLIAMFSGCNICFLVRFERDSDSSLHYLVCVLESKAVASQQMGTGNLCHCRCRRCSRHDETHIQEMSFQTSCDACLIVIRRNVRLQKPFRQVKAAGETVDEV